jgi:hypothetical protein
MDRMFSCWIFFIILIEYSMVVSIEGSRVPELHVAPGP